MRIYGARKRDYEKIQALAKEQGIVINIGHLESMAVVMDEENNEIIAFITLESILEASIVTNEEYSKRDRVTALKLLIHQGWIETQRLKHDKVLVYTTNDAIDRVLQRKFNFEPAIGSPLIGRVDRYKNG